MSHCVLVFDISNYVFSIFASLIISLEKIKLLCESASRSTFHNAGLMVVRQDTKSLTLKRIRIYIMRGRTLTFSIIICHND